MWWLSSSHQLARIEDRMSTIYVERCHVDRVDNGVVIVNRERTIQIPAAWIASLLLGPGTRITHGAVRLLADSATTVCWVGENGIRMYAAGQSVAKSSALVMRQAYLVTRPRERLNVARKMYLMRFPGEDVSDATMQQLRGYEGSRVKKIYRAESKRTGVKWNGRVYVAGDAFAAGDDVNRLLSAGHSCLYGISHAAIVGLGGSAALGFVHTGKANSFVLDIADLYKAEYTIPLAFDLASEGRVDERDARAAFRDRLAEDKLMARIVADILRLLKVDQTDVELDRNELWDDKGIGVAGGRNYDDEYDIVGIGSRPNPGVNDNGRRFLQELPTQRRKDYARVCTSISHRPYPRRDRRPVRRPA